MRPSAQLGDEAEVAHVDRLLDLGEPALHAVKERRRRALEQRLAVPALPHCVNDLVALLPASGELEYDLGRVLEVCVHDDHGLAGRRIHASGDGDLMAEVARQLDNLEPRILQVGLDHELIAGVPAAIVDQQHFSGAVHAIHDLAQPLK